MRAVTIDDDVTGIEQLRALLNQHCKQIEIIGSATGGNKGAEMILALKPDLVFLDIRMPDQSGFEMLSSLGIYDFNVIFVTGHDEYAIQAIRCSALDYLVKPIVVSELVNSVNKATQLRDTASLQLQINNLADIIRHPTRENHKIALPITKGHRLIDPAEILYLKSSKNYTHFFTIAREEILISKGMYLYEELMAPFGFLRCHTSYIVNLNFIEKFQKEPTGYTLLLIDKTDLPVSSMHVPIIKKALNIRKLLPA